MITSDPLASFRLDGKVALVTGGNGGLGQAVASGLRAVGAEVVVTGRDAGKNREAAADHGEHNVLALDVRDEASVEAAIAAVSERHGRLDVLVNNAGVGGSYSVLDMTLEEWRLLVDTSLTGSFLCAKYGARAMIAAGNGGAIINLGSMYSVFGPPRAAGYASAKAGILGLSRSLAVELAPHGIRSNAILPGWIETAMTARPLGGEIGYEVHRKTPAGRFGRPDDLIGAAIYLASDASAFVTGIELPVDGGYRICERPRGVLLDNPAPAAAAIAEDS
ncbi:MAG: 2-dehydro-3-deoxy-D-gluconate 5-dehydrogenase [Gaiellales bacterium]|jgi:2-deoxy-D-gluconate 3-dehydrogenase|nr:2-dehydro-3-deoxy-D-gluconate 5-dehydrogenase [Gaiellales bacterium]